MPKKLFVVDVEIAVFQMCVLAEDRDNATRIALEYANSEFSNIDSEWLAGVSHEATELRQIPKEWRDAMPYTDDDEQDDCATYISAGEAP